MRSWIATGHPTVTCASAARPGSSPLVSVRRAAGGVLGTLVLVLGAGNPPALGRRGGVEPSQTRVHGGSPDGRQGPTTVPTTPPTTMCPATNSQAPGRAATDGLVSTGNGSPSSWLIAGSSSRWKTLRRCSSGPSPQPVCSPSARETLLFRDGRLAALRAQATVPPLVGVDEEGGRVQRLEGVIGVMPEHPRTQAASMTPAEVEAMAAAKGQAMKALGVDIDFAPVVDVAADGQGRRDRRPRLRCRRRRGRELRRRLRRWPPPRRHPPDAEALPWSRAGRGRLPRGAHHGPTVGELAALDLVPYRELLDAGPTP